MSNNQEDTAATGRNATTSEEPKFRSGKIDRNAPAGSENSLGAQSVRDGRPATDDGVVEAMDEEGPGISDLEGK